MSAKIYSKVKDAKMGVDFVLRGGAGTSIR